MGHIKTSGLGLLHCHIVQDFGILFTNININASFDKFGTRKNIDNMQKSCQKVVDSNGDYDEDVKDKKASHISFKK